MAKFQHFRDAQEGAFERALSEIASGKKKSDWMRFIFPQVAGLSVSIRSVGYEIENLKEAREYLADPLLGPRLRQAFDALVALQENDPKKVFDDLDAQKLWSSATLFDIAEPGSVFGHALEKFFGGRSDEGTRMALLSAGMRGY